MQPEMSIVVGTRNRPEAFRRFVESAVAASRVSSELIVADAGDSESLEETAASLRPAISSEFTSVALINERPRAGTAAGYNTLFSEAIGRYVTYFNDDCELLPGWDRIAVDFMDAHPEVGIGAIYFLDRCEASWQRQYQVQSYHGMHYANFGVVRREVGEQIGWFGDTCRHYGVDNVICLAAIEAGWAVAPIPGCKCKHWREHDGERLAQLKEHSQHDVGQKIFQRFAKNGDFEHLRETMRQWPHLAQPSWID